MNIHEMFGRQAEKMQELAEFHAATMKLLNQLLDGSVAVSQIVLTQTGWEVQAAKEESTFAP